MNLLNWIKSLWRRIVVQNYPYEEQDTMLRHAPRAAHVEDQDGVPVADTPQGKLWITMMNEDICPDCRQKARWIAGPQGGLSQNIKCAHCGHWYNVTPMLGIAEDIGFKDGKGDRHVH